MDGLSFKPAPFRAARWARGCHTQTILARILRSANGPPYRRERVETPDGDFLDLDWGSEPSLDSPIVLVLHGLEGSSSRRYIRNICRELFVQGIWPVALNFRGCSGEPNRKPRYYHSGETSDPGFVLEILRRRFPDRPIGALGFSLGGNVLLKLLGEESLNVREKLDSAVAISVPYDLAAGSQLLEQSQMGRFYAAYFLQSLKRKIRLKQKLLRPIVDLNAVLNSRTIWEFDDVATAPLNGFESAAAYYAESSSCKFLEDIAVPTLLIHAEDDPFLPAHAIPRAEASNNPIIQLVMHPVGGHVGFLEGTPTKPSFWAEVEGARFLAEHLNGATRQSQSD